MPESRGFFVLFVARLIDFGSKTTVGEPESRGFFVLFVA